LNREILKLAIPSIISNISIPLVSAVDTALMGHLSSSHLAAIGVGAMVFVFIYGSFNFLRMGTTGLTAQAYGKKDNSNMANTLSRALIVALVVSLFLIMIKNPIFNASVYLMNIEDNYQHMVKEYFDIRIFSAPAVFLQYALMGWYFGMQNALIPLYMTLIINVTNIAFSYYFVNYLHLDIEGVAYGTIIGQYLGVIFGFVMLLKYTDIVKNISIKNTLLKDKLLRFFIVNRDIFIRTLALTFSLAFLFSQAAKKSEETLAVMVLLLQFMVWMSFAIDGFANATESLVGKYYGSKEWENFNKSIRYNFYWGGGAALLFSLTYFFLGRAFLELYTNQTEIINQSMRYMWLVSLLPLLSFTAFIWDGVFVGMTASKSLRDAVLSSTVLFVVIFYLTKDFDYEWALWGSFVMFFVFRGAIQSWMFLKKREKLN